MHGCICNIRSFILMMDPPGQQSSQTAGNLSSNATPDINV